MLLNADELVGGRLRDVAGHQFVKGGGPAIAAVTGTVASAIAEAAKQALEPVAFNQTCCKISSIQIHTG